LSQTSQCGLLKKWEIILLDLHEAFIIFTTQYYESASYFVGVKTLTFIQIPSEVLDLIPDNLHEMANGKFLINSVIPLQSSKL
jgi:hypothetical protein